MGAEVRVSLPTPTRDVEPPSLGCSTALFWLAVVLMLLLNAAVIAHGLDEPTDVGRWAVVVIGLAIAAYLLWYLRRAIWQAKIRPEPVAVSVLLIGPAQFRIERAGVRRDLDVSWELSQIADIALCPTNDFQPALTPKGLFMQAISMKEDLVRVSVELTSGEVEDVVVRASGRDWIAELEARVRAHLGCKPGMIRGGNGTGNRTG